MEFSNKSICARLMALFFAIVLTVTSAVGQNQNDNNLSNTPYSRYGYGRMGTTGNAMNKSMGDLSTGLRTRSYTNLGNPASLTAIDTLSMIFSIGLDAQLGHFTEAGKSERKWDAGLSYMSFHFQTWSRQAMSISLTPYSMVGYNFGGTDKQSLEYSPTNKDHIDTLYTTQQYYGVGGLNNVMVGYAWSPIRNRTTDLSIGVNGGFIWGSITNSSVWSVESGQAHSTYIEHRLDAKGFYLKLGLQFSKIINAYNQFTLGATWQPKVNLNVDAEKWVVGEAIDSLVTTNKYRSGVQTPGSFSVGATYKWDNRLTFGVDYELTQWSKAGALNADLNYAHGSLSDVHDIRVGIEFLPRVMAHSYLQACRYRLGFSTKNGYCKIPIEKVKGVIEENTLREFNLTAGVGFPVNKRCSIDLGVGYQRVQPSSSDMLKENYFKVVLGLTFNEMMFFRNRLR